MMRTTLLALLLMVAAAPAVAQMSRPGESEAPARAGTVPDEVRRECQADADRRFRQIPAVRSGLTSYIPGERERLYRECLEARGYRR